MNAYEKVKVLNKGAFGVAVLAVEKATGKNYVIKQIDVTPNIQFCFLMAA